MCVCVCVVCVCVLVCDRGEVFILKPAANLNTVFACLQFFTSFSPVLSPVFSSSLSVSLSLSLSQHKRMPNEMQLSKS